MSLPVPAALTLLEPLCDLLTREELDALSSLQRQAARRAGKLVDRMVNTPVTEGLLCDELGEEVTDIVVAKGALRKRAANLAELIRASAQVRINQVWRQKRVCEIAATGLRSHAYEAMLECYGKPRWPPRKGVYAPDRVRRMSEELAGRTLRSAARRLSILEALVPLWLPEKEYKRLDVEGRRQLASRVWDALPDKTKQVEYTAARRQLQSFYLEHERKPKDAYEASNCPELGALKLPLDACDCQLVRLEDGAGPGEWVLKVRLPVKKAPANRKDWAWHQVPVQLLDWAAARYGDWRACTPSLQITQKGVIKLQVPMETVRPPLRKLRKPVLGPIQVRAFSCDWGQRRQQSCAVIEPSGDPGFVLTSGRPYFFQAMGGQVNLYRTRDNAEHLAAKTAHIEKLLAHKPDERLRGRREDLLVEKGRQWAHLSEHNQQLARDGARWMVESALAEDCNLIILEDLDTLEARNLKRTTNGRVSLQVRGALFERIHDLAVLNGIRVLTVKPKHTSAKCSHCGARSRHYHAPDKPRLATGKRPHKNWLVCACGHSADRDHSAAERIGARGLQQYEAILIAEQREVDEAASAEQSGRKRKRKSKAACERECREAQDPGTTPLVRTRYTKRSRLSKLPLPDASIETEARDKAARERRAHAKEATRARRRQVAIAKRTARHAARADRHATRVARPALSCTSGVTRASIPIPSPYPSPVNGQRPRDAGSPRSVSRGVIPGVIQLAAARQSEAAPSSQTKTLGAFTPVRRLDGMLHGNRASARFTRPRTRHPELPKPRKT